MNKQNTEALAKIIEGISEETKKEIIELAKRIKEEKKKDARFWKPECGKEYWVITSDGEIAQRTAIGEYIYNCYEIGNAFRTLEEVEFENEKRKVKTELERYALEHNDQDYEEWDRYNSHYCIQAPAEDDQLGVANYCNFKTESVTYFTSEKIAKDAIVAIGEDRIKKYLFNIPTDTPTN